MFTLSLYIHLYHPLPPFTIFYHPLPLPSINDLSTIPLPSFNHPSTILYHPLPSLAILHQPSLYLTIPVPSFSTPDLEPSTIIPLPSLNYFPLASLYPSIFPLESLSHPIPPNFTMLSPWAASAPPRAGTTGIRLI